MSRSLNGRGSGSKVFKIAVHRDLAAAIGLSDSWLLSEREPLPKPFGFAGMLIIN
jgi:hypothetical protein